jgi:hypothetical protein
MKRVQRGADRPITFGANLPFSFVGPAIAFCRASSLPEIVTTPLANTAAP